jgi:pyruvate,water dikinase
VREKGVVYRGNVPERMAMRTERKSHMKGTPIYETLRRVADLLVPLRLVDPKAPDFLPQSRRSLHDIMRFIHELSYTYMFRISDAVSDKAGGAVRLKSTVPLDLYLIDLGGGLKSPGEEEESVTIDDIASLPFWPF